MVYILDRIVYIYLRCVFYTCMQPPAGCGWSGVHQCVPQQGIRGPADQPTAHWWSTAAPCDGQTPSCHRLLLTKHCQGDACGTSQVSGLACLAIWAVFLYINQNTHLGGNYRLLELRSLCAPPVNHKSKKFQERSGDPANENVYSRNKEYTKIPINCWSEEQSTSLHLLSYICFLLC